MARSGLVTSLAAEAGFHDQRPSGIRGLAAPIGHTWHIMPQLLADFTKNPLAERPLQVKLRGRLQMEMPGCRVNAAFQNRPGSERRIYAAALQHPRALASPAKRL
jgi:hypothetical protein